MGRIAVLPLLAIMLATAYRRSRAAGSPPLSWRERLRFALAVFGIGFVALGLSASGQT
jgi:hypothetical protein